MQRACQVRASLRGPRRFSNGGGELGVVRRRRTQRVSDARDEGSFAMPKIRGIPREATFAANRPALLMPFVSLPARLGSHTIRA